MRRGSGNHPLTLDQATPLPAQPAHLEVVALGRIIGTLGPTRDFDASFRPASDVVRNRWERIALARRRGIGLPAIVLREHDGGYYVVDGRHRVSVARAAGDADIEAWVSGRKKATRASERLSCPAHSAREAHRKCRGAKTRLAEQPVFLVHAFPNSGHALASVRRRCEQAEATGSIDRLRSAMDAELGVDVLGVRLHGMYRHVELVSDFT